jgi:hypothetical protein
VTDDDEVKPEEMAALARGLRRSALRVSPPEDASSSDGREAAAAYHAPATPPPPAASASAVDDGVLLSATLQRDLDDLDLHRLRDAESAAPGSFVDTVPGRGKAGRRDRTWVWVAASVGGFALLVATAIVLLEGGQESSTAPPAVATSPQSAAAASAPGTPPAAPPTPVAVASAQPTNVAPAPAAPSATVVSHGKSGGRGHPSPRPDTSGEGSSEMINPPL